MITILSCDPGLRHFGYCVLSPEPRLHTAGTWIPPLWLSYLDRHLWFLTKVQDLLTSWQPVVLAFEQFVHVKGAEEGYGTTGRAHMDALIGGLEALVLCPPHPVLCPPHPVLWPLHPSVWPQQLVGADAPHKADIVQHVNQCLRTTFHCGIYDEHTVDAIGVGLVALAQLHTTQTRYQERRSA